MQIQALGTECIGACWGVFCDCPQDHSRACSPTLEPLVGDLAPDLPWVLLALEAAVPKREVPFHHASLVAFSFPPELPPEVVSKCRRHGALAIPADRYNPDTALNLLFSASLSLPQALSPCSPNFPKEPSLEPSYQLSHSYPD